MCFKYCDVFPTLFDLADTRYEGNARRLSEGEATRVLDLCFQCKLCEVQCPYTPRDGHEFQLDFPRLVHRQRAHRTRARGIGLRARLLSRPNLAGRMARASLGLANVLNRTRPHRWLLEKLLGIHREKRLPGFARSTFGAWAAREGLVREGPLAEAVLFPTCFVENNAPEVGRDTVEVLRRNGVDLACVRGLGCCGMPAWERGDLDHVRAGAAAILDALEPFVEAGSKVVAINPTCSMMLRREWPELLDGRDRERARKLAEATRDPSELLWSIRDEERFCTDFRSTPGGSVAYHAPCHLRAQAIGFRGRDLLRKIPGVKPMPVMECSGHDGTWAMTVEGFEPSQRVGAKAFDGMRGAGGEEGAETWVTDCPLAALQFAQHAGVEPIHPMTALARAYREDGFPTRIRETETSE